MKFMSKVYFKFDLQWKGANMYRRLIWLLAAAVLILLCCRNRGTVADNTIDSSPSMPAASTATTSTDAANNSKNAVSQDASAAKSAKVGAKDTPTSQTVKPATPPIPKYFSSEICLAPQGAIHLMEEINKNSQGGYDLVTTVPLPDRTVKNPSTGATMVFRLCNLYIFRTR
jgi:hypothetical protein